MHTRRKQISSSNKRVLSTNLINKCIRAHVLNAYHQQISSRNKQVLYQQTITYFHQTYAYHQQMHTCRKQISSSNKYVPTNMPDPIVSKNNHHTTHIIIKHTHIINKCICAGNRYYHQINAYNQQTCINKRARSNCNKKIIIILKCTNTDFYL